MKRADIIGILEEKAKELGIPEHVLGIKKVPSRVEMDVIAGSDRKAINLRCGATRAEVEQEMRRLENWWNNRQQQVDLEEAIVGTPPLWQRPVMILNASMFL